MQGEASSPSGSYEDSPIKGAIDKTNSILQDEPVKKLLLLDDEVLLQQAAFAVGADALNTLCAHYIQRGGYFEAAMTKLALLKTQGELAFGESCVADALALLARMSTPTTRALQLELTMRKLASWDATNKENTSRQIRK